MGMLLQFSAKGSIIGLLSSGNLQRHIHPLLQMLVTFLRVIGLCLMTLPLFEEVARQLRYWRI